ncbi:TOBE domain-containing protein [Roseovarius salinarum]|uniref:TOBE domain-containing protein n=1 Tax=Roseovarius salinarum TaxID=1981892 RepID=UPI002FCD78A2
MIEGAALGAAGRTIGIRPEHIVAVQPQQADLAGRVRAVEYLGAQTHVVVDHPAARGLILCAPGHAQWQPGDEIGLGLPEEHRVLFDAGTGRLKENPQQDYGADHRQTAPRDSRKALQPQPLQD